jgi:hypothetical protein
MNLWRGYPSILSRERAFCRKVYEESKLEELENALSEFFLLLHFSSEKTGLCGHFFGKPQFEFLQWYDHRL